MSNETQIQSLDIFISQYDSAETKRAYSRDIRYFFEHVKKTPKDVTKADAISYVQHLKNKNLQPNSVARSFYAIRSYMKFLVGVEVISRNVFDGIRVPKSTKAPEPGLSDDEIIKMISVFGKNKKIKSKDKAIFNLMLYNGLRRSEVCGINYGDIRTENGVTVLEIRGKGNKTRVRPLHPACSKAIIEYLKKENRQTGSSEDPIFTKPNGARIDSHNIYTIIERIARESKIERKIHPHMLRAKFASMALESGQPITSVQVDMGHSSIETTSIYDKAKHSIERSSILGIKEISRKK